MYAFTQLAVMAILLQRISRPTTLILATGFGDRFRSSQGCTGSLKGRVGQEREPT